MFARRDCVLRSFAQRACVPHLGELKLNGCVMYRALTVRLQFAVCRKWYLFFTYPFVLALFRIAVHVKAGRGGN